jgi:dTDP-glucose 4,6-dehydratase
MRLLVTGGAGFMGSNFIRHILQRYPDYEVVNFDKLTYAGNLDNLRDIEKNPRYRFVKGDRSLLEPKSFVVTDVLGTYTLLEAVKRHGIKKYIQISTDEVYGAIEKGEFTEKSPFEPNSPYAASKAGGDLLCRAYQVTYKLPVIVTHSCNFFGFYHYPEKFIPLAITNVLEDKKVPVYGDGKQMREWIFHEDFCSALDVILHKGKIGEVYNIGTGEEKVNLDVVKLILKELGKSESYIEFVKDRPGHDVRYRLNWDKLRSLGWQPQHAFEDALKKTIEWYRTNDWWWKKIKSGEFSKYYREQYNIS